MDEHREKLARRALAEAARKPLDPADFLLAHPWRVHLPDGRTLHFSTQRGAEKEAATWHLQQTGKRTLGVE